MAQLTVATVRMHLVEDVTAVRDRVRAAAGTTPGRLTAYLIVLTVVGALTGLSAVIGAAQRSDLIDSVANRSGPLAVQAQQLYRSLSDADASAAAAFLTSAAEPPDLRQRYQDDLTAASAALAAAASVAGPDEHGPVARIAAALPVYSGLVETARTQNRLNLPVGAAYLREASALMRDQLLPAADELYRAESATLAGDLGSGRTFPWLTVALILLTLVGLGAAQLYVVRRTQRLINVGLATATAAALALLLWVSLSWVLAASDLGAAQREGSSQVQLLAQIRIAALQARADEALTLVARGSGGAFEDDFQDKLALIAGADGSGGLLARARAGTADPGPAGSLRATTTDIADWRKQHHDLRALDDSGQYPQAVAVAVGDRSKGTYQAFARVDEELQNSINTANATFAAEAGGAGRAMGLTVVGWIALTLLLLGGVLVGLRRRIGEYR